MTYYQQLKARTDILGIAQSLGFDGKNCGSSYNGNCPGHGSSGEKCLVIWPSNQRFKCFHCGEKGDVISLVALYKRCEHQEARDFLAVRVGMPLLGDEKLTPGERAKRQADAEEESLVYDMLTEAAEWCHQRLKDYPAIHNHLRGHYGFSEEIIKELQIGFVPPMTGIGSELARHLEGNPRFKGKLTMSGLFSFKHPTGPYYDFFQGRIVFPFWKSGKVVNMVARTTAFTPEPSNQSKYLKLRRHDPDDEKRKHISKFVGLETFMGEDTIREAKEIVIAEGAPDWVSGVDHGFAAISPVTTNFREQDWDKLGILTANAEAVYIINDNESNGAGLAGALRTGKHLTQLGRKVFLVELPRPEGADKIDLNEYLKDHNAADVRKLMAEAKSIPDILIDQLPNDFLRAQHSIKSEVLPLLLEMDAAICEHYLDRIAKTVKATKSVIKTDFEQVRREAKAKSVQSAPNPTIDPEVQAIADGLAKDPELIRKRIDIVNQSGVVGERNVIAMNFATLDSRLLPEDKANPNALAIKNAGHHGSGKSYALKKCLEVYDSDSYHLITSGSAKSLYYLEHGLKHKALIVTEAFQFLDNKAQDNEFAYVVRCLLSEGCIAYQVPEKDDDGKFRTVEKKIQGPTAFITTTNIDKLEPQLEDRLFSVHPDESMEQTRAILSMTARIKDGSFKGSDPKMVAGYQAFHAMLKPVAVVIPYASRISEFIQRGDKLPISTRRAFNRVMSLIQTIACAYQYQRTRDGSDRVVAERQDYWMALQIVQESFRETMGQQAKGSESRVEYIREQGVVHYNKLKTEWGVSKTALSKWVSGKVYDGVLTWCNEDGVEFEDEPSLKKAKHSGQAYLKINPVFEPEDTTGLPSPFELIGDDRWADGGELLELYDLHLNQRGPSESNEKEHDPKSAVVVEEPMIETPDRSGGYDEFAGMYDSVDLNKRNWIDDNTLTYVGGFDA